MQLTKSGLLAQFRRDPEFRSSVISYVFAIGLSASISIFPYNIQFTTFVCMCTAIFISCYLYKFMFIYCIQAGFLGWVTGSSVAISIIYYGKLLPFFSRYLLVLSIFHFTEFAFTAITNRKSLQPDSFLLNHSKAYWGAAILSWIEFAIEAYFFPGFKIYWISFLGVVICFFGEFVRKTAMVHAGLGFTHRLALSKRPEHRLVTNGIYAYVRHPGWLFWSIGTQITLCNPVCFVIYAIVSWKFMDNRIYDEEKDLIAFFGDQYVNYQGRTWSGIPFSRGYI